MTTAQMKTNREWNAGTSGRDTITIRVTTSWPKMMRDSSPMVCVVLVAKTSETSNSGKARHR